MNQPDDHLRASDWTKAKEHFSVDPEEKIFQDRYLLEMRKQNLADNAKKIQKAKKTYAAVIKDEVSRQKDYRE